MPLCRRGSGSYREEAKALWGVAQKASPGPHRDKLLELAANYERLADITDRRNAAVNIQTDDPQSLAPSLSC
jgi:hypothetical protein